MIGEPQLTTADDRWQRSGYPPDLDPLAVQAHGDLIVERQMPEVDRECSLTADEEPVVRHAIRVALCAGVAAGVYADRGERAQERDR